MSLGNNLKKTRINKNLTQKELAEKSGITRESIGNYERGDRIPPADILEKIATALGVSLQSLLWAEDKFIKDLLSYFQKAYRNSTNHFPREDQVINILAQNSIITDLVTQLIQDDYNNFTVKEIENIILYIKKLDPKTYEEFIEDENTKKNKILGEKISTIRKIKNFSIEDLSIRCNETESFLNKLENGFIPYPPNEFLYKIASALDISVVDLTDEDSINRQVNKDFYTNLDINELSDLMKTWNVSKEYLESMSRKSKEDFIYNISKINPIEFRLEDYSDNFENFTKDDLINFTNEILNYGYSLVEKFIDTDYENLRKEYIKTSSLLKKSLELNKINEDLLEAKTKEIEFLKSKYAKYENAINKLLEQIEP